MKKDMIRTLRAVVVVAALMGTAGIVQAQDSVPAVVNFQGELFDPSAVGGTGGPLTGVQQVEFRIYDNLTGGTLIWGRSFPVFCNNQGVFNVLLGDSGTWLGGVTNSLRSAFQSANRYLEMTVGGHGGAIAPRQQFVSAPFAMHSAYSTYADVAPQGFEVDKGLQVTGGGANVVGTGTFQNDVTVNGNLTANNLSVTTSAMVGGNLSVTAPSQISGYGTVPIGAIVLWHGAANAIPNGWALCNGQNGTPNLQNQFIVGAGDSYAVNATGGATTVALATANMPGHTHTYKDGFFAESSAASKVATGGGSTDLGQQVTGSGSHDSDNNFVYWRPMTSDSNGSGTSHENRPPYYALCYIMRTN